MAALADAYGNTVLPNQQTYVAYVMAGRPITMPNPYYNPTWSGAGVNTTTTTTTTTTTVQPISSAGASPQYRFTFNTIGQVIYRAIGHVRLPLMPIWYEGIVRSGDPAISDTITFAAALCCPIDSSEVGLVSGLYGSGGEVLYDPDGSGDGITIPEGTSDINAELLRAAILAAIIYPGDEAQEPCPIIVADKGASVTNAFRGLRYIVIPNWPLAFGLPSQLVLGWERTTTITTHVYQPPSGIPAGQQPFRVRVPQEPEGHWEWRTIDFGVRWCYGGAYWWAVVSGFLSGIGNIYYNSGFHANYLGSYYVPPGSGSLQGCHVFWDNSKWSGNWDIVRALNEETEHPDKGYVNCWSGFCDYCTVGYWVWVFTGNSRKINMATKPDNPVAPTFLPGSTPGPYYGTWQP